MLPVLLKKTKGRDELYYHYYEYGEHKVSPHFGIRTNRYKLIRFYQRVNSWELFDLEKDPHEMHNLYGRKGYTNITVQLQSRLQALIEQYGDAEAEKIFQQQLLVPTSTIQSYEQK
jgi:hypothetical protein